MSFDEILNIIKYSVGTLGILAVIFIVAMAIKSLKQMIRRSRLEDEGVNRKIIESRWSEIESLIKQEGEMSSKLAIMEADKLLDYTLKSMALPGETLGERLKFACYKYDKLKKVWWAHKVRNEMVHESSFKLDKGTARRAIDEFKRALQELGAL